MPLTPHQRSQPAVVGMLGSLALSAVRPGAPTLALRALRWQRDLQRLGVDVSFHAVHDIGLLFAAPSDQVALGLRTDPARLLGRLPGGPESCRAYERLIQDLAQCEAARRAAALRLSDDMVVVVLAKLLAVASRRLAARPSYPTELAPDAALFDGIDGEIEGLFSRLDRTFELQTVALLEQSRLFMLTVADALDLDTLHLLGVLGSESGAGAALQVDLIAALSSPAAHDVVNFSLEILPSVLETKARPGASTRAGFGCGGLGNKGSLDNLVLTELAWDAEDFTRRFLDNEVLYYTKETEPEPQGRRHVLLIDASASMRGEREVFARGMALATSKKLVLEGESVSIRFFDSRLYEAHHARGANLPTPHVLSFVGERGRNPRRVFSELVTVLDIESARDHRDTVIHIFTHAALYVPRDLIAAVKRSARIGAVFILPSGGELNLDYVDLLDSYWVVDHATLAEHGARASAARNILGSIGSSSAGEALPGAPRASFVPQPAPQVVS